MSWFDKAMANAGVDKRDDYGQQAIEKEQAAKQEQANYDTAWNYIKNGDVSGFADYSNRNLNYRDIPFLGQFVGHAADAATQGVADFAQFAGAEGVGNYLNNAAQTGEKRLAPMSKPELSLNYITDPNGLTSAFGSVVGSMLPIGAVAYTAPIGGLTATAANVASKVPYVGGLLGTSLPHAMRWGLTGPVEAAMEAGGAERDMREQGMSNEEARQKAWEVFGKNAALLAATNAVGGAALPHIFKGVTKAAQNGSRLAGLGRFAGATGTEVGINALEEGEQQGFQSEAMGKPASLNPLNWSEEQKEAAEFGVAGTAPFALFGLPATIRGMRNSGNDPTRNESLERAQELLNQQNQAQAQSGQTQTPIDSEPTAQPAMSVQEAQSRISAPTISAENSLDGFDNRYVSKWESKPGATNLANVQQSVKNRFNAMMAEYGDSVILTGGAETGGYHQGGGYGHEGGWKLDVDINSVKDKEKFLALCKKYGFAVGDESDKGHYDLSGHRNGGVGGKQIVTPDSFISDGGQATSGTGKREGHANAWAAYDVFRKAGYSDEAIAGILGRVQQEHNFDTSNVEEYDDPETGLHLGGYGMFQWNGGRTTDFLNWAQENNLDPQNPTVQAQYALIEAQQRGLTPERMNQLSAEDAADVWTKEWEVGVAGSERQYAAEWRDRIKNGGSAGGSTDIESPKTKIDTSAEDRAFDEYNKQLDELAEKGIEASFKSQKELVQEAKNAAIEAGDMDEVQRINSAERSGNAEELAKIADKALKAKQKEVKGKPAPATPEIKMASPNLVKKVTELLNTAKEQGVPLRDTLVQNTLNDGSEETMQNFAGMLQSMINAHGYEQRKDQGKQLLDYADENQVDLKPGLRKMLREGQPKAIEAAQNIINEAQPTISNQEQVQPQPAQTPVQEQPIQNQQLTLQDRVNQVRGNEPGTPVSNVKVSELASITNNAGSQQQAPSQELKQVEPTPTAEAAPADEDYHGFFDDKKAGAVREAKKRLEEKINPFGDAEGFRTVKSIVERWAETDESNQSSTKGKSYYVHGNKVSKAAYDYYNHLRKNADEEVKEKSVHKQENGENVDNSGDKSAETKKATDEKDSDNELSQQEDNGKIETKEASTEKPNNLLRYEHDMDAIRSNFDKGEITSKEAWDALDKLHLEIHRDRDLPVDVWNNLQDAVEKMEDYVTKKPAETENGKSKAYNMYDTEFRQLKDSYQDGSLTKKDLLDKTNKLGLNIEKDKDLASEEKKTLLKAIDMFEDSLEEVVENEQQGESGSPAGGHAGVQSGESGTDQRGEAREVSGRDGREGSRVHEGDGREDSEGPATSGVREGTELEEAAGNGDNQRGNQPTVPLTEAEAHPSPTEIPGNDYEIKDTDQSTKSEKVRFKQNVEAIKMLKQLEADDRMPTPAEQEILGAYNGWGGLKGAFLDGSEMNKELRDLLTDDEYKAAQSTINDAFYTPPKLIRAIWEGISHLGFKGGRVLDPSMGVGNFFGTMPRDMMDKSALRGVELDNLTSRFAKMLYPSAFVENKGFQRASVADNYFDLAISNIPFGQNMINGYQVHNYFFANGIDKVRPGGLMVYITSQGSLAGGKDAAKMRNYLENQADLIAAYKLPSGVFSDAGTQVATDIVVFRKRDKDGKKSPYGQKFGDVKEVKTGYGYYAPSYGINEYFVAHPENILGEQSTGRDQWGNTALNVKMAEGTTIADVADDLRNAMQKLPDDVYQPVSHKKSKPFDTASAQKKAAAAEKTRDYEYYYKDGKPVQNQNGQEVELTGQKAKVVNDYLKVKNTLNALFAAESDPKAKNKDVEGLRKKLNKDYDAFVAKHGSLTGTAAKNYADDPSAGMVQALEKPVKGGKKGAVEKADIFTTRSIKAVQEVTHVETADDALIASLTNRGAVDLDYMAELTNSKPETLISKLKGKLFKNPATEDYETRDEYLSGNVRQKLAQAKEAAKSDKAYADNVKELEKVIPEDLVSDEIFVNLGTPWIPVQDVQAFVDTLADNVHVSFSRGAALWTVTGYGRSAKYKLKGIEFPALLSHVLNNKAIQIYDGSGDNKVFNQEKTDAANVAAEELQQDFKDWIWKDKDREKRLVKYYNENYNNTVVRQYDGQHLNLHAYGMNAKIELKPHQKDVVWRMLQGGNTLIAHCVGAGKTFEMQAAGMEMRRLGIANKPMYCLPNNVVEQFAREFRQLYPNAKLLVLQSNDLPAVEKTSKMEKTEDGRKKRVSLLEGKSPEQVAKIMEKRTARNRMLNRIRTEDWDGIIISHNLFQRFPVTPETAADFIQQEIDTLEQTIREAKQDRMDSRALSNLETSKKNLQERLEEVISTDIEDIGVPFEELGIDQLFVDEADMFKNLAFATRLGNIRGLSNSKANRSQDMFLKTQWLTNNMDGRGVVFATGTPVSNTMSELYTMMRYLDMKGLKEKGLEVFDNWMRTFGDIGQGIERKPTGDGFRKVTMIKRFINMAELTKMFRSFADVKVQDELNLDIPKLKNDKSTVIALEPDEKVVNYIKKVVPERVKKMKSGFKKEKGEDNMLSLTNDLRKLSLTDSKIEACADAIAKKYHDTADVKGTQLVFCDMGIPKAESDKASGDEVATTFDVESPEVYRTLIAKLKEKGIPDKDVAFIQNYNTKTKRDNVFQKVNEGEVRILIGSTETMGAGTNCQKHLVALHDLDAPWRPRDLEQRHGRILRQGNENKQVEIFNYVVKDSFDANMWEKLKNKAAIIQQAMSGDMNLRTVEDSDLVTLSYAEVEGAATGNPLIKEQLQVQNDLTKYQHAQTAFRKKVRDAENTLAGSEESIAEQEKVIAKIEKDIAQRKDTKGDKFSMLINGKAYKDRTKADEALAKILDVYKQQKSMDIGQIGGFRLTALYRPDSGVQLQLVNNRAYEVKTHSVAGVENTLRNAPDKALEYRQSDLDAYKQNIAQAQEIVQQENPYAEKVKQLSDRLNQLNREIADTLVDDGKQKVAQAEDTSIDSEPEQNVKQAVEEGDGLFHISGNYVSLKESFPKGTDEAYRMQFADLAKKYQARNVFGFEYDDGKTKPSVSFDRKGDRDKFLRDARKLLEEKPQVKEETKKDFVKDHILVGTVPPAGKSTANVNVDEFEHTKTGKMIPAASLKDHVDKDFRKQATAIAKNHGGKWSPFAKRILFKTEQGRDDFVRDVEALLSVTNPETSADIKLSVAWHGSPHDFDTFSLDHIGEGEGQQVHGWGLYFAQDRNISESRYKERLTSGVDSLIHIKGKTIDTSKSTFDDVKDLSEAERKAVTYVRMHRGSLQKAITDAQKQIKAFGRDSDKEALEVLQSGVITAEPKTGRLFEVEIPDSDVLLDEQKPFSEQPEKVQNAIREIFSQGEGFEKRLAQKAYDEHRSGVDGKYSKWDKLRTKYETLEEIIGDSSKKEYVKYNGDLTAKEKKDILSADENKLLKMRDKVKKDYDKMTAELSAQESASVYEDAPTGFNILSKMQELFNLQPKQLSETLNKHGIKGITYEGGVDGRCFVIFDDQAIEIINKFSAEGEIRRAVERAVPVANEDLTPQQRKMSEFGEQMGTPILWISTDPKLHGFHAPNGTTVLNVRSNMDLSKTFWHETFHWIANNNESLYNELMDYFKGKKAFSEKQLDAYRKKIGRPGISDELAIEEMLADNFEEVTQRVKIFKEMGTEQPSLARKFVAWVKRIMDKFAEFFHNPEGKLTTAQRDSFVKAFGRLARDMKDGEGRPLFKVYKEGKEIRLPSGQLVTEGVKLSAKNDIDNGGKVGDNETKIESVKVNNRLSLRQDGHFDVKLLKKRPKIGVETSADREQRRKEEIDDMDRLLKLGENPDAYAELLSDRTLDQIEEYRDRMGWNYVRLAQEYERKYNGFFAKYSPAVTEENVIGALMNLKGAIRYARQHGNISRRNRYAIGRNSSDGRKLSELGADNTTGTRTGRTEQVTSKHSELSAFFDGANMSFVSADVAYNEALYRYQNAKSDSEKEKAYAELKRLVEQAAKEAGFENAIPEQTVAYKTRTKAAPKKTIKVYKVFTVASDGSPTALFVGGTEKLPQGVWLDAMDTYHFQAANGSYYVPSTKNPHSKGGATGTSVKIPNEKVLNELKERGYVSASTKVGTAITGLAYRPGWHAGTLPFFPQGGMKVKNPDFISSTKTPEIAEYADTPYPNIHRYNQVVFECELAFDKDYNEAARATKDGDLEYLPEDGSYYYATNPLTRAKPELGAWVISGSLKIGRALTQEECDSILAKHDMPAQQWEGGTLRKGTEAERQAAIDNFFEEEYAKVDENGKRKKKQFENREVYQKWYDKEMAKYPGKIEAWEQKVADWEAGGKKGNKPKKPPRPKAINAMASGYGYISGKMNLADLGYTGQQYDAARKTLAPITYDDNGKVIPLSERFNAEVDDIRFSYGPSDNSSEGLWHRIKNIMAGKGSEDSEKFRYRKHLTEMIEKALDVKLRYGKMEGNKSKVVYKPEDRVLRSRHAFDWENILPVAGRIAAEQLEIEPTESMNNYIADWILTGAPNNVSKEADTFHKAMREHPAYSAKLEDLYDAFAEWIGKDYREQMQGSIQWKNKQKPTMQERKNKLYEEFVEELEPINRMVKQVNANLTEKGQKKLGITADPMIAFRMLRGSYGRAIAALEGVNDGAVDALKHAFPNVDFTGFKTLYQILKSIDAFQNADKQRDFVTYCTACHIMDMHQHNDDIRQEQQHLKNKIEKLGTSKEDEKQKAEYEEQIEKLNDALMPIPATYSKDNCQKYINDGYDKYHDAQQDLVHFSNTTAAMLADSGVISEKRFKELLSKWQNYVPLFRVFEDNEDINFGDSMKHIKGSTRDIVNPLESIIRNTAQFIQKAELNKAKCLLADVARCDASGWLIEEVDKSDSDKTTITFLENGQRKYLQTDPDIVRAVNNMGVDSSHFFIKFLHAITRVARACFTMASPEFALRNVARDWGDASLFTKYGVWINPLDIVKGCIHAIKRDNVYYEWLTQGAAQASALSLDRDYTQSTLDKLGRSFWKRLTSRDFANALLEGLQMAGEYSEYGTRIAMYQKTKNAILKDKPNATKEEVNEAMLEAAFESRDLMDFARHGKAGAEYNKVTAFANASIQGWDKLYRSLDFRNDPKRATRTAAKLMLYGAVPAIILFMMYKDEDWYREAPEWLKSTHWLLKIGDREIRIPKAADMGIRFISNAVEVGMDEAYHKNPRKLKDYFRPIWDAAPNLTPTSILPILEIEANHSYFTDRPIIPRGQDKLPPKLQYGPYTTSLAKWVGETFNVAPRNVEHFISGYFGTLGMAIPKAVDLVSGEHQQSLSLEEMPLIRGYLYPQFKSPSSVERYYKEYDEQTKLENEYKLTKKRPEGFDPAKLQRLKNAHKQLQKINKQEKSIIDNPKWSLEDRETMQKNINKKRIEIAKRALGQK